MQFDAFPTTSSGTAHRVYVAAAGSLAIALLMLSGVASWSAFATSSAGAAAQRADRLATAYDAARFAVAAEESLERKYRLEQGAQVRAAHRLAKADLDQQMHVVLRYGGASDRAFAWLTLERNAAYYRASQRLLAAADRHDVAEEIQIDHSLIDPPFGVMQDSVYAAADVHRAAAETAERRWRQVERVARWATSLAVGTGAALILLFFRLRRRLDRAGRAQAALNAFQAAHDALTGLPNRLCFTGLLGAQLALSHGRAARGDQTGGFSVVLLDLDRFKEINDTLGHHYGDLLLQQVGPRLRTVLREDDVLARLGGDEFALLLHGPWASEQALMRHEATVRRILAALHEPFLVEEVSLAVEASAGIAVAGLHGDTAEELLQRADIAMYLAKTNEQGLAIYDRNLDSHSPRKLTLLTQLRQAVGRNELVLHYQPLIDLTTDTVTGVEALVRWQHPDEGLLSPSEFLPLAESSGFIHELTRHVLDMACRQARDWERQGHELTISVNLSARCLLDSTLPLSVQAILQANELPARLLKLEVTESAIIADPHRAQEIVNRLHALGVLLSIDDFGTGYTSLAYLRDLPVHELKIDRSFVSHMLSAPKDAAIVRTVVELAARLSLRSVAEGVEDPDTLATLKAMGCSSAQGFHIGRPMPASALTDWMRAPTSPRIPASRQPIDQWTAQTA